MTAIGAVHWQAEGENRITVSGRRIGGICGHRKKERRNLKNIGLRVGTLHVGTKTEKRRSACSGGRNTYCVQETSLKGSRATTVGAVFKLFYHCVSSFLQGGVY